MYTYYVNLRQFPNNFSRKTNFTVLVKVATNDIFDHILVCSKNRFKTTFSLNFESSHALEQKNLVVYFVFEHSFILLLDMIAEPRA